MNLLKASSLSSLFLMLRTLRETDSKRLSVMAFMPLSRIMFEPRSRISRDLVSSKDLAMILAPSTLNLFELAYNSLI